MPEIDETAIPRLASIYLLHRKDVSMGGPACH
jgi:hypothetical protein